MAQEMCNLHPDNEVIDVCVHCGKSVCVSCSAALSGKTYCLECIKAADAGLTAQTSAVAWENRSEIGFLKALLSTWKDVVLHPGNFFSSMPAKAPIGNPFLFSLVWGSLAIIISAFVNVLTVLSGTALPNIPPGATLPPKAAMVGSYIVLMIISPLLVAAGIFIISGIYHLIVLLFGGKEGFRATFRVLCYTNALAIFNIIPLAGPFFVTIYSIILFVIGFKHAQRLGTARAVTVALLPMILLFIVGFAAAFYLARQGTLPGIAPMVGGAPAAAPMPVK